MTAAWASKDIHLLLKDSGYPLPDGLKKISITGISADARTIGPGELFIAVRGQTVDGHLFVADAIAKGCAAVIVEKGRADNLINTGCTCIELEDTRTALGRLSASFHGQPARKMHLTGITGTNGKTTSSLLIEKIVEATGGQPGVIGTIQYRYKAKDGAQIELPAPLTTPEPVQLHRILKEMADNGVTHVIMEASSHALAQDRLSGLFFDVAVFTNLTRDHLDFHGSMKQYFASKKKLFSHHLKTGGHAVIVTETMSRTGSAMNDKGKECWGADLAKELAGQNNTLHVITCGMGKENDVHPRTYTSSLKGIKAVIRTKNSDLNLHSRLTGDFNLANLMTAAAVGNAMGIGLAAISKGLAAADSIPGRLQRIQVCRQQKAPAVFVDYAHTPDAMENVLSTLVQYKKKRLVCVFGCGGDRDQGKRPQMGKVAAAFSDLVILTSDNPRSEDPVRILREIEAAFKTSALKRKPARSVLEDPHGRGYDVVPDRAEAIRLAIQHALPEDIILICGKGHETYQITAAGRRFFDDRIEAQRHLAVYRAPEPAWDTDTLLRATGGRLLSRENTTARYSGICTDTRKLQPGDLFVCLAGPHHDGAAFIDEAFRKGATGVLVQEKTGKIEIPDNRQVMIVDDTLKALGDLAAFRRLQAKKLQVIGITGSCGKTTVKEMTATILSQKIATLKTKGNFNNLIGLPLSILPIDNHHRAAVLEMGMNVPGEIARLTEIAAPDISCITNIKEAHIEGLGSINGVAKEKGALFAGTRASKTLVVNLDDANIRRLARQQPQKKITFACTDQGRRRHPLVWATHIKNLGEHGVHFTLHIAKDKTRIHLQSPGLHNLANSITAAAISHAAGIKIADITAGLQAFMPVDKRSQLEQLSSGLKVINDSYNANPASMQAALETLQSVKGKHLAVAALGDMLELGGLSKEAHYRIGRIAAELNTDFLCSVGSYAGDMIAGARAAGMSVDKTKTCTDKIMLVKWLATLTKQKKIGSGDWLLVKGSRGMSMETILNDLKEGC